MDAETAKKLAEGMGLAELRAGCQILRDARGWREDEIYVASLWYAAIRPSFHDGAILCWATTEETKFRGKEFPAWCRGGLLLEHSDRPSTIASTPIKEDLLCPHVASLDIMARSGTLSLDGIGYEICFPSGDLDARIQFFNPVLPALVAIERALHQTAQIIAQETKDVDALAYVEVWREYLAKCSKE